MDAQHAEDCKKSSRSHWLHRIPWLLIPVMLLSFTVARAQQLTATLSGTATDQTDARIPGAKVVIKNQSTGDIRNTVSDSSGFWSVTALIPGTYTVTVSSKGFASWEETDIVLSQGDNRTVANIHLKISSDATAVTVVSGQDAEVPTDTAEVSATLNNQLVDTATISGRNAAELIKMMPGVAFNNAGGVGGYSSMSTGTNNGPAGSFSANGTQPYGSTDVYLDGANLIDPGNAGTQVANINQDMTDSIKYLSASYGAEYAKGPAVLQAFSKTGGQKFHGEAYLYARNSGFGFANDWNTKSQQEASAANYGLTPSQANQVNEQHYYYIGGNIGGPVILPFTHFNRNRDKLFFWGGYEYMLQHPYNAPVNINVPTASGDPGRGTNPGQREGNFNNAEISSDRMNAWTFAYYIPCVTQSWQAGCNTTDSPWMTGLAANPNLNLSPYFDPLGVIASNINPKANEIPNITNNYSNYVITPSTPQNRWEATGKVTYALNDNNKIWGTYAYQTETDNHPLYIWWQPATSIPYPGKPSGKETAHVYLANYTHVFNASTTNEVVFAYSEFVNDNNMSDPNAASRTAINWPNQSIFGASNHKIQQFPDFFDAWADKTTDIREYNFYGGIYGANSFGKTSKAPSIADTFTKIIGAHSVKAGFYWDMQENLQAYSNWDGNGEYNVSPWSGVGTGNVVFDRYVGRQANYNEAITTPVTDAKWHEWSIWAQDSWKVTRKITLNLGLRADHNGQWYDATGTQVWDAAHYDNTPSAAPNTGLAWHKINSSVPLSGWTSPLFYYNPRLGVAWDLYGNGRTVLRAGFGTYRYQVSQNDSGAAMQGPQGSFNYNTSGVLTNGFFGYNIESGLVNTTNAGAPQQLNVPAGLNQNGASSLNVDKWHDNQVPYANTYSFGIAQALPAHTVVEISYVGSASREQLLNGTSKLDELNPNKIGVFFQPDPNPYSQYYGQTLNPGVPSKGQYSTDKAIVTNDYRPLHNYGTVQLFQHGGYANYNSVQISGQKQSGNLYLFSNFTYGKVLGTRDGSTANGNGNGNVVDPFNLANNYGPLAYDHTKILNVSFSYKLPSPIHGHWALGQAINGWQLSGYTTYQDGSPYQANNPVMNAQYTVNIYTDCNVPEVGKQPCITMPNGHKTTAFSTSSLYGTDEYPNMMPILTCDPRVGLHKGQFFNPACFAAPLPSTATSYGQMGQWIWPYIRTPHYVGSDLAVFKAFRINDSQRIEARVSATNWLNHPNQAFGLAGTNDNELQFNAYSTGSALARNTNAGTTGYPLAKQGFRWIQFAAKWYF